MRNPPYCPYDGPFLMKRSQDVLPNLHLLGMPYELPLYDGQVTSNPYIVASFQETMLHGIDDPG